jgi:glycerophosphoryl diester phosphodiesterase
MMTPAGLKDIAGYADSIGPELRRSFRWMPRARWARRPRWYDAHAAGLMVIPYTFRPENHFQASNLRKGADNARNAEDRSPRCAPTWPPASMPSSPMTRRWAGRRWMGWAQRGTERSTRLARRWPRVW